MAVIKRSPFRCAHNKFLIDDSHDRVRCGICNEGLNPMWVLMQLCNKESRANMEIAQLNKIADKAREKISVSANIAEK